jgi:homoserine kinase
MTTSHRVRVFAPATVANLGPGFDVLGLALVEPGDTVTASLADERGVRIRRVRGDKGALPLEATANTAGIAAEEVLRRAGAEGGVELELDKGLPLGSGLGSSAASAAAAALAVNLLLDSPLSRPELIECCVEAEAAVSGRHADNAAPAVLGGLVLVRSTDPLDVAALPVPESLVVTVVTPEFELPTRRAREALPERIPLGDLVRNTANVAALVHALHAGDAELLGRSLVDSIVTPARAKLIPGCPQVIRAAREAGAIGSSISGAGPSVFALCRSRDGAAEVAAAMAAAFRQAGLDSSRLLSPARCPGARVL